MVDDWQNVINLIELSQLNLELAVAQLDDTIQWLQEAQSQLAKAGKALSNITEEIMEDKL